MENQQENFHAAMKHGEIQVSNLCFTILEGVTIIVPSYLWVRFLKIFPTNIFRPKILKSLTQGFQQVQNPDIFVAKVPEASNYNASIWNMSQMPEAEELN